ncbi:MAG: hypothetical protein ACOY9Y_09755 [Bacillota bacterium]
MPYNLQFITETFGGMVPFIDTGHLRWIRGAVTLDAEDIKDLADDETTPAAVKTLEGKYIVKTGAFIGKLPNGKWTVHNGEGEAESNVVPMAILAEDADVEVTGDMIVTALDHARVIVARLPVAPNAYVKASLKEIAWKE